jgi:hypothetical protein
VAWFSPAEFTSLTLNRFSRALLTAIRRICPGTLGFTAGRTGVE